MRSCLVQGISALTNGVDLTDLSAVINALPNGQKQFTDYFFYVEGQATTDDGFYFSDTLRGALRFDTENDKLTKAVMKVSSFALCER